MLEKANFLDYVVLLRTQISWKEDALIVILANKTVARTLHRRQTFLLHLFLHSIRKDFFKPVKSPCASIFFEGTFQKMVFQNENF